MLQWIWLFLFPLLFFFKCIQHILIKCLEVPVTVCDCSGCTQLSKNQQRNYELWYDGKGVRWEKANPQGEPIFKLAGEPVPIRGADIEP